MTSINSEYQLLRHAEKQGWKIENEELGDDFREKFDVTIPSTELLDLLKTQNPFSPHWPADLKPNEVYEVACDDKGRDGRCWMRLIIANDCDVHLTMYEQEEPEFDPSPFPSIRVRNGFGGGRNMRTYQALLWLAQAMKLDGEERDARRSR